MDPGSNTTTITVTAENGDVKKYVIYTEKETAQETTTEKATETTAAQQETTQQQEETTIQEETTETQESQENQPGSLDVIIGGVNGYIRIFRKMYRFRKAMNLTPLHIMETTLQQQEDCQQTLYWYISEMHRQRKADSIFIMRETAVLSHMSASRSDSICIPYLTYRKM